LGCELSPAEKCLKQRLPKAPQFSGHVSQKRKVGVAVPPVTVIVFERVISRDLERNVFVFEGVLLKVGVFLERVGETDRVEVPV